MAESARDKFVRLAEARVNNIIKTVRLLSNLSNRSNYSYDDKDVEKIFRVLECELRNAKASFKAGGKKDDSTFKLG